MKIDKAINTVRAEIDELRLTGNNLRSNELKKALGSFLVALGIDTVKSAKPNRKPSHRTRHEQMRLFDGAESDGT